MKQLGLQRGERENRLTAVGQRNREEDAGLEAQDDLSKVGRGERDKVGAGALFQAVVPGDGCTGQHQDATCNRKPKLGDVTSERRNLQPVMVVRKAFILGAMLRLNSR